MPKFDTVRRIPFSAEQMFDIVADIERYPEFLPLCDELKIIDREQKEDKEVISADMTVNYKSFSETFRSNVTLDKNNNFINSVNLNGPFTHLISDWSFKHITNESCDIHFQIDYEFKNWMLSKLMGGLFDKAFQTYADSFEQRAVELYAAV